MSILNDLIRIKKTAQADDLIKMMDEIPVYEKLSVDEQFRDLKSSEITRTKCPMLAAYADNKPYETVLGDLVANVYLQIEGHIPEIFRTTIERTPKQQKQFEILQAGVARVHYSELTDYHHEVMAEHVTAVFTNRDNGIVTAVIIIRSSDGYHMYHGSYMAEEREQMTVGALEPLILNGQKWTFIKHAYSMLGNNGYPFGIYQKDGISYEVMIGPDNELFLMEEEPAESTASSKERVVINSMIPPKERNELNMAKGDPESFATVVLSIIESVV